MCGLTFIHLSYYFHPNESGRLINNVGSAVAEQTLATCSKFTSDQNVLASKKHFQSNLKFLSLQIEVEKKNCSTFCLEQKNRHLKQMASKNSFPSLEYERKYFM